MDFQERQKQQRQQKVTSLRGDGGLESNTPRDQSSSPATTPGIPDYPIKLTLRAELEIVQIPSYTRMGKFIAGDAPKTPAVENQVKEISKISRTDYPTDTE